MAYAADYSTAGADREAKGLGGAPLRLKLY